MTKLEFVTSEIARFDATEKHPFRVAIGGDGDVYPYGSHTERREYGDTTVGYTFDKFEAILLLAEAYDEAEHIKELRDKDLRDSYLDSEEDDYERPQ